MANFYTRPELSYAALGNQPDPMETMMKMKQLQAIGTADQINQAKLADIPNQMAHEQTMREFEVGGAKAKSRKELLENHGLKVNAIASALGAVTKLPPELQPGAIAYHGQQLVADGVITPEQLASFKPEMLPSLQAEAQTASEQIAAALAKEKQAEGLKQQGVENKRADAAVAEDTRRFGVTSGLAREQFGEAKRKTVADAKREWYNAKTARMSADAAAKKKDVTEQAIEMAAQSIAAGDLTSLKSITGITGDKRLLLYNRIKELNPKLDTSTIDRKIKMEDDRWNGKMGQNLQSFGTFLEHAGQASTVVDDFRTTDIKLINKPLNWLKTNVGGDPKVIQLDAAIEPVRKEFEGFLLGGRALYADDRKNAEIILNPSSSPAQIQAALKQMGHTATARLNENNYRYKGQMGKDLEGAISPEAAAGASKIGADLPKWAGGSGGAQPMYAVNPQTKERIVSNDGGQTWQPAP